MIYSKFDDDFIIVKESSSANIGLTMLWVLVTVLTEIIPVVWRVDGSDFDYKYCIRKIKEKHPTIDVEELRQIKIARKRALELQRQKEEEERQKALELQRQQEEEARRKAEEEAARIEAERQAELASKSEANTGVSYDELVRKLNASLNSTLAGTGETFAKYAIELGIDPYLAVAIVLHETGCKWTCSSLLRECNNVGGMKGSPGCNGGSYKSFSSLDEGIKAFMNNLYNNYYAKGLTTPETIGPKYAASSTWASQIRNYMNELKAN